ncbi:MAG: hypothetical protein WHV67_01470 [Thermoanaerobaculia bacterium]
MLKTFLIILLSVNLIGSDFRLDLQISNNKPILGEPIYVCISSEYIGKENITIAESAFSLEIFIENINGEKIREKKREVVESIKMPYDKFKEISFGWSKRKCEEISSKYYIDLGQYYVWGRVLSKGPYKEKIGNTIIGRRAWEGEIETEKELFALLYPEGIDKEAYEYFKRSKYGQVPLEGEGAKELLEKFPTSTYAGWVVQRFIYKPTECDIETFYKYFEYKHGNSVPTKEGWQPMDFERYINWQKEWAEEILRNHPDFAMAEELKLLLAVIYFWQGDEGRANQWLDKLGRESKGYKWGKEFINYLKEKRKGERDLRSREIKKE